MRHLATGPVQTGKTLIAFVIPILYGLFELQEDVLVGVPDAEMVADKFGKDLLPIIEKTRYRNLLPATGAGSRGGTVLNYKFLHGPSLRFVTGGGRDKSRAGLSFRIIVITEVDGFDEVGGTSAEGTKLSQVEARAESYQEWQRMIFHECTVSTDTKHTWDTYANHSTCSRLLLPCPHCHEFVHPEREHLIGWQDCANEIEAGEKAALYCPACGQAWTDQERREANKSSVLVHAGQHVDASGNVIGDHPPTNTFGFRWTAVNNCLLDISAAAKKEWEAPRSQSPDLKERALRQFVWAIPVTADVESISLTSEEVMRRRSPALTKGIVPDDTVEIGFGADWGKRLSHWVALAERADGSFHVVDYGRVEVPSDDLQFDQACRLALAELNDIAETFGSCVAGADVRWQTDNILAAIRGLKSDRWYGHYGFADNHFAIKGRKYLAPKSVGGQVIVVGDGWHLQRRNKVTHDNVVYADACVAKMAIQSGFRRNMSTDDRAGAFALFSSSDANEHVTYSKHIVAETQETIFEPGKGHRTKWKTKTRANHFLDATYIAYVAIKVQKVMKKLRAQKISLSQPSW